MNTFQDTTAINTTTAVTTKAFTDYFAQTGSHWVYSDLVHVLMQSFYARKMVALIV